MSRAGAALAVLGLTIAALVLRCVGLDSMLPYQLEPDHGLVRTAAWLDRPADVVDATPWAGPTPIYPWLMPRILQAVPGRAYPAILPPEAPLEEHLASASRPFHRVRVLAALLSALAVPFTYKLARSVLGRKGALLAAALVASSVLLQNYGQQGRAHGPMAGLTAAAMAMIVAIPRAPTWKNYLVAALASGLAVACLHTGGFLLPAFLAAHVLSRERRNLLRPLAALGVVAGFVALFYPSIHTVVPWKREGSFSGRITEQLRTFRPLWEGLTGIPDSLAGTEPVLSAVAVLGAVLVAARLLRRPRPSRERMQAFLVCGVFVALFFLFWVALFPFRPRYLTSLVPFLAVLGAYGVVRATRRVTRPAASFAIALAVLAWPAWICVRLARLRAEPDTAEQAAAWLAANVERGRQSVAFGVLLDLPILQDRASIERIPDALRSHWQRYQARLEPPEPSPERMGAWPILPLTLRSLITEGTVDAPKLRAEIERAAPDFVLVGDRGPEARGRDDSLAVVRSIYGAPVVRFPPLDRAREDGGPYPGFDLGPDAASVISTVATWGFPIEIYAKARR